MPNRTKDSAETSLGKETRCRAAITPGLLNRFTTPSWFDRIRQRVGATVWERASAGSLSRATSSEIVGVRGTSTPARFAPCVVLPSSQATACSC